MGDASKTALVAVRDRREAVIQILSESFANDLLEVETFEERTARAHQSTTVAALDALIADLAPLPPNATSLPMVPPDPSAALSVDRPQRRSVTAVFSSVERRGSWVVPNEVRAIAVFGSTLLDFREASFATGVTELRVRVVFGNLEIIVPPQLAVECDGTGVFASFAHGPSVAADPGRPLLRIVGTAVFGNVEISTRLPGESGRDARRRARRDRRALAGKQKLALPPRSDEE